MTEYLTVRELWLMAMAWNEAIAASSLKERGKMPPQILNWLNTDTEDGLSIRQVLSKVAPKEIVEHTIIDVELESTSEC